MLSREATNTSFIVFGLTRPGLETHYLLYSSRAHFSWHHRWGSKICEWLIQWTVNLRSQYLHETPMNIIVITIKPLLYILVTEEPMMIIQEINRKPMLTDMAICNTNMDVDSTEKKQHFHYFPLFNMAPCRSRCKVFLYFEVFQEKGKPAWTKIPLKKIPQHFLFPNIGGYVWFGFRYIYVHYGKILKMAPCRGWCRVFWSSQEKRIKTNDDEKFPLQNN